MISEYKKNDISNILYVINEAALKYKGVIPDECWHEPYMLEKELIDELDYGVHIFGYSSGKKLIGVMGIQEVKNVILIRHAYILSQYQRTGIGKLLLEYLLQENQSNCFLVGTWRDASWAVQFYEKFNFILQTKKQTNQLLNKYWKISSNQIENSVVLKKINYFS